MADLAFTPAWELAKLLRAKKLSPMELVQHLFHRIAQLNPKLNAYLTLTEEEARTQARAAERRLAEEVEPSPLLGIPVSVKDLLYTKGVRTTGGSLVYRDWVPLEEGPVVERLKAAGAIILGKTNTPELGQSATTENKLGEDCRNPWDLGRTSGGSSGGAAAAVAAGLGPLAIGTDGGGSIRVPATFCGVFGFKPTFGLVPAAGGFGGMPIFSHTGPITRSVRDAALLLQAIAGYDRRDPRCLKAQPQDFTTAFSGNLRGLRAAWSPDLGYARVDPGVRSAALTAARALNSLGCPVEEPGIAISDPFPIFAPIVLADTYAAHGHLLEERAGDLMPYVKSTLEQGRQVTGSAYSQALRGLEAFRQHLTEIFERYDLLLTPATAVPAFPLRQRPREIDGHKVGSLWGPFPFTSAFNLTGQPAASIPCGFSPQGLPMGLQVIGRYREDVTVLRACAALERALPWADKTPPL